MKKQPKVIKRYIIRKYILAKSAHEALKLERKHRPDDVFVDNDYKKDEIVSGLIGFSVATDDDYED